MGKLKAPIPTRMDRPVPKVTKVNHVYRYQGYYCLGFMVCQTVRYRWYQESLLGGTVQMDPVVQTARLQGVLVLVFR